MVFIDNSNNIYLIAKQNLLSIIKTSFSILIHQFYITVNLFKSMDLSRMEILVKTRNEKKSTIVGITTCVFCVCLCEGERGNFQ